ncbi:MAG: hypothetical protein U1E62_21575 [Alsobacter sp.]
MIVLALDIGTNTGWAHGKVGGNNPPPISGSVRLKRTHEPHEVAPFNLHCFLRDRFEEWAVFGQLPDLAFLEHFLNPVAQPSADAAIMQLQGHGAAQAFLRSHGIRVEMAMPATIRKHFIGTAKVPKGSPAGEIKRLVRNRCAQLGYCPRDCTDYDRTDALAAWDYAAHVFGRAQPRTLQMFGGAA